MYFSPRGLAVCVTILVLLHNSSCFEKSMHFENVYIKTGLCFPFKGFEKAAEPRVTERLAATASKSARKPFYSPLKMHILTCDGNLKIL